MLYTLDALIMAINAFLIMTSLFILCKDFLRNPNGVLMNIYSFSLVFALFYYGVPFLNIEYLYSFFGYNISLENIIAAKLIALWILLVFFISYFFSRKRHLIKRYKLNFVPTSSNVKYSRVICYIVLCSGPLIAALVTKDIGSLLIINFNDRVSAQSIYSEYEVKYKLPILFYLTLISYFFVYISGRTTFYKKILILLPFLVCIPEALSGGRDLMFAFVLFCFVIYSLNNSKRKILLISVPAFMVILAMVIIRYYLTRDENNTTLAYNVYSMLAEFYHTAFTSAYVFEHDLNNVQNGFLYLMLPLLKFFTPLLNLFNDGVNIPWYADVVSEKIGRHFGFAGNIISESFFYFGYIGTIIMPIIIVLILSYHNRDSIKFSSIGFTMYIVMAINVRLFFRGSFWDNYTSLLIWLMIFFTITGLLFSKRKMVIGER